MDERDLPGLDPENRAHALSVYEQQEDGGSEEFPVLKAFQQYIDAEQEKARKRMITMSIYFAIAFGVVVTIFVILLVSMSGRNQALNDRLVDFAMREREKAVAQPPQQPVVVQQPVQPNPAESAALAAMTTRLEMLQKQMAEREAKAEARAEKAEERFREAEERARKAEAAALAPKPPVESEEVKQLKALLEQERAKAAAEKAAAEKEKARQAELEAYRRKHYPECYAPRQTTPVRKTRRSRVRDELDEELDAFLNDDSAVNYFEDETDDEEELSAKPVVRRQKKSVIKKVVSPVAPKVETPKVETPKVETAKVETSKVETKVSTAPKGETRKAEPSVSQKVVEPSNSPSSAAPEQTNTIKLSIGGETSSWGIPTE